MAQYIEQQLPGASPLRQLCFTEFMVLFQFSINHLQSGFFSRTHQAHSEREACHTHWLSVKTEQTLWKSSLRQAV